MTFFPYVEISGTSRVPDTIPASGSNTMHLYTRNRAGRMVPEFVGPSGVESALQPALFGNSITMLMPTNTTTVPAAIGTLWTSTGTLSNPAITVTSLRNQTRRLRFATTNGFASAACAGVISPAQECWRGVPTITGSGGWFFFMRFSPALVPSASFKACFGLSSRATVMTVDPDTQNDTVCLGKRGTSNNWELIFRGGNAANTNIVDLGVTATAWTGSLIDLTMFAPPNGSVITFRIVNQTTGEVIHDNVSYTGTYMPRPDQLMYIHGNIASSFSASNTNTIAPEFNRIYVEKDF
jgi:hypothetical protein